MPLRFSGASAKSLKIVVAFTLPDGTLPQTEQDICFFHQHAYFTCAKFYEAELGIKCERTVPTTQTVCRISTDEHVFLNASPMLLIRSYPLHKAELRAEHGAAPPHLSAGD